MYFIKRIREEKKNTYAKPSGEAQFEGMIYGGGLHFVGGEPYTVGYGGGGARSSAREGEKLGPKKNRKPSAPARFRVRPVKRRCRVMVGGGGVGWTRG